MQAVNLRSYCLMSVRAVIGKKRKRKAKPDNPAQSAGIIAAAKKRGIESVAAFDRAIETMFPRKPKSSPKAKK